MCPAFLSVDVARHPEQTECSREKGLCGSRFQATVPYCSEVRESREREVVSHITSAAKHRETQNSAACSWSCLACSLPVHRSGPNCDVGDPHLGWVSPAQLTIKTSPCLHAYRPTWTRWFLIKVFFSYGKEKTWKAKILFLGPSRLCQH